MMTYLRPKDLILHIYDLNYAEARQKIDESPILSQAIRVKKMFMEGKRTSLYETLRILLRQMGCSNTSNPYVGDLHHTLEHLLITSPLPESWDDPQIPWTDSDYFDREIANIKWDLVWTDKYDQYKR